MALFEILLTGILLVVLYVVAAAITDRVERWRGAPLGIWRSVLFFVLFLAMLLVSMQLLQRLLAAAGYAP